MKTKYYSNRVRYSLHSHVHYAEKILYCFSKSSLSIGIRHKLTSQHYGRNFLFAQQDLRNDDISSHRTLKVQSDVDVRSVSLSNDDAPSKVR
jgi:hypothetical protein